MENTIIKQYLCSLIPLNLKKIPHGRIPNKEAKKPFQVALTKEAFISALMKQQGTLSVVMYVEWHPHASVQILFKDGAY